MRGKARRERQFGGAGMAATPRCCPLVCLRLGGSGIRSFYDSIAAICQPGREEEGVEKVWQARAGLSCQALHKQSALQTHTHRSETVACDPR